jgi:CP family cyanate transporter-like MFS transporter
MTGVYVTLMGIGAAIAGAVSVPLASINSMSWRLAMIPWALTAAIAAIYWWQKMATAISSEKTGSIHFWNTAAFKDPIAWVLVLFFGLQSMVFYSTATWLPTILLTKGFSLTGGAIAVSFSGLIGSLAGLMVPHFAGKYPDKRMFLIFASIITGIGFFLITVQSGNIIFVSLCLANMGMSICFPLALMLAGSMTTTPEETRNVSTMMQSIGYVIAAIGPAFLGTYFEVSNNDWDVALLGVLGIVTLQLIMGVLVGKPKLIRSNSSK